jgi:NDP-sugar pyrophosphorylase family protein
MLVGSDILVVSGDLVTQESVSTLVDLHRANAAGLTILLNRPAFDLTTLQVSCITFSLVLS